MKHRWLRRFSVVAALALPIITGATYLHYHNTTQQKSPIVSASPAASPSPIATPAYTSPTPPAETPTPTSTPLAEKPEETPTSLSTPTPPPAPSSSLTLRPSSQPVMPISKPASQPKPEQKLTPELQLAAAPNAAKHLVKPKPKQSLSEFILAHGHAKSAHELYEKIVPAAKLFYGLKHSNHFPASRSYDVTPLEQATSTQDLLTRLTQGTPSRPRVPSKRTPVLDTCVIPSYATRDAFERTAFAPHQFGYKNGGAFFTVTGYGLAKREGKNPRKLRPQDALDTSYLYDGNNDLEDWQGLVRDGKTIVNNDPKKTSATHLLQGPKGETYTMTLDLRPSQNLETRLTTTSLDSHVQQAIDLAYQDLTQDDLDSFENPLGIDPFIPTPSYDSLARLNTADPLGINYAPL